MASPLYFTKHQVPKSWSPGIVQPVVAARNTRFLCGWNGKMPVARFPICRHALISALCQYIETGARWPTHHEVRPQEWAICHTVNLPTLDLSGLAALFTALAHWASAPNGASGFFGVGGCSMSLTSSFLLIYSTAVATHGVSSPVARKDIHGIDGWI